MMSNLVFSVFLTDTCGQEEPGIKIQGLVQWSTADPEKMDNIY